jgi:hypothetical protein
MTTGTPVFPTLSPTNKLLHHFRFIASSFVTNFSAYIFDTAIGGNFDAFLRRDGYEDVFTLARAHYDLLNDVLSACLMRTGQKSVADVIMDAFRMIVDVAVLVQRVKEERMEEYQAAPEIERLHTKFKKRIGLLVCRFFLLLPYGLISLYR